MGHKEGKTDQSDVRKSFQYLLQWLHSRVRSVIVSNGFRHFREGSSTICCKDFRSTVPRLSPENLKANMAFVDLVEAFAKRKNATPAQVTLAWVLAQKPWFVLIPGTTKLHRLQENLELAILLMSYDSFKKLIAEIIKIVIRTY